MKKCTQCDTEVSLELKNIWPSNFKASRYWCIDCSKKKDEKRRETKEWKEYHREYGKKHDAENTDVYAQKTKAYRSSPEGKAIRNNCNRKRAIKIERATPNWAGDELIKLVYLKAQEWGFAVDHIIPVGHKLVCGLHTWHNLQLLSTSENSKKHNKFLEDW